MLHQLLLFLMRQILALPLVSKAPSLNVVFILEKRIDFNAIELDDTTRGKGDVVTTHASMEGDHKHLLHEVLLIYTQEDPYLISLLGQEKYIDIIKKAPTRWVEGVCIHLPIVFFV